MAREIRELGGPELRFAVALDGGFSTIQELTVAHDFVGQERTVAALELGLGMRGPGFHLFVHGLTGTETLQTLRDWIAQRVADAPTPGDSGIEGGSASSAELEAGEIDQAGTLNAAVDCRLRQMALALKTCVSKDPRARLPGHNGEEFL